MKGKVLWRVSITTSVEAEEAVSELLGEACGQGVASFTDVETGQTKVMAFFEQKPTGFDAMRARLVAGLARMVECGLNPGVRGSDSTGRGAIGERRRGRGRPRRDLWKVALGRVRREDWAEAWKRHFRPLEVGSRLLIRPSWGRRKARKGQALVVLDPGLSFGTGQHPTTAFCLEQIVARRQAGRAQSLCDVGTGSGILAIAAAKLGYGPVEAVDVDSDAVRTGRRNARLNRVASIIRFRRQDCRRAAGRPVRKYSVVCANLISSLLVEERERLLSRVDRGGLLVLAGILATEFAGVQKAYEASGWRVVASRKEGEWRSGAFQLVDG